MAPVALVPDPCAGLGSWAETAPWFTSLKLAEMRQFLGHSMPASAQSELLIGDVFRDAAQSVPNRVAAELGERPLTFGEIDRSSNRLGRGLRDLGVAIGDRVAVIGSANLNLVPVFAATAKLGAVYAPIDPDLEPDALLDLLQIARPAVVVIDDERANLLERAGSRARSAGDKPRETAAIERRRRRLGPTRRRALRARPASDLLLLHGNGPAEGVIVSHRVQFLRTHLGALEGRRGTEVCAYPLTDRSHGR